MAELANCSNCGKVFAKHIRDICDECFKKEEEDFETVYHFLKEQKNREATIQEIVEKTGVPETTIIKFIKNKRLRTSQFPKLMYPCEMCGKDILTGRFCEACTGSFMHDLETHQKQDAEKTTTGRSSVYHSLNRHRK